MMEGVTVYLYQLRSVDTILTKGIAQPTSVQGVCYPHALRLKLGPDILLVGIPRVQVLFVGAHKHDGS